MKQPSDGISKIVNEDAANGNWTGRGSHRTRRILSAGTLAGDPVRNSAGEDLGKIEEIMLDLESGRVAYAVFWAWETNSLPCPGRL